MLKTLILIAALIVTNYSSLAKADDGQTATIVEQITTEATKTVTIGQDVYVTRKVEQQIHQQVVEVQAPEEPPNENQQQIENPQTIGANHVQRKANKTKRQ